MFINRGSTVPKYILFYILQRLGGVLYSSSTFGSLKRLEDLHSRESKTHKKHCCSNLFASSKNILNPLRIWKGKPQSSNPPSVFKPICSFLCAYSHGRWANFGNAFRSYSDDEAGQMEVGLTITFKNNLSSLFYAATWIWLLLSTNISDFFLF